MATYNGTNLTLKNLIPYPYNSGTSFNNNGISYKVNTDGSITANGTASPISEFVISQNNITLSAGQYILNGCPAGGGSSSNYKIRIADKTDTQIAQDIGQGVTFTLTTNTELFIIIVIYSGVTVSNLTFYPMIRYASNTDPTYEPYSRTYSELANMYPICLYGRNRIPFPYYNKSGFTADGITWTINNNGSVTANGTATKTTIFILFYKTQNIIKNSTNYTLSGCPKDGGEGKYKLYMSSQIHNSDTWAAFDDAIDYGKGAIFTARAEVENYDTTAAIYIYAGVTVNNLTFKPMLEIGSVVHPYEPYSENVVNTTHEYSQYPFEIDSFPIYKNVDSTVNNLINQLEEYQKNNDFVSASALLASNPNLKNYLPDSYIFNLNGEAIRNCQIMAKAAKQMIYIDTTEPLLCNNGDVWIGE